MKITRRFTTQGSDPFASVKWTTRSSRIVNPDGSVVFEMADAAVPESWSQLATDIMVSKYFRKAGVPMETEKADPSPQPSPPRGEGAGEASLSPSPSPKGEGGSAAGPATSSTGPERSAKQVIHRLAGCWRHWGEAHGYFDSAADAQAFYDEITYMMVHQMAAPNSPQWFNTGLAWAYGLTGPAQGHYVADPRTGAVRAAADAYTHPQPHACFIQSIRDDLVNPGGIMDLWVREARLFKYGSGTGTNFSLLRAEDEALSGGGKSSGLMSWLKIGDRAAGAIKSGGTTRRAAKMVCLDLDHPDIEAFVNWKVREEVKVAALVEGLKQLKKSDAEIRETAERLGLALDYDFNGEAYQTVSGQNSNNSARVADRFFDALDADEEWELIFRTSGKVAKTVRARDLWEQICYAAWRCADPGVQFDSTINAWHTCPTGGRINASNPCSEYMFLDDTACNLASLNLLKFFDPATLRFDTEAFEHAAELWTIVLEISVLMASFPSEAIARKSFDYRTLGLGYANLGALLMQAGIPYDSEEARALCGGVTALLTGAAYRRSAKMAASLGPFARFHENREDMLRVIRNHRRAALGAAREAQGAEAYEGLRIKPVPIDHGLIASGHVRVVNAGELLERAVKSWDEALSLGQRHGYRNAQVSVIAPTGTIGLLMDCDTTGVEPDFALVKFKKLAGGGYFKIANQSLRPALASLGYSDGQIREILTYVLGTLSLDEPIPGDGAGGTLAQLLREKGLTDADLQRVEAALPSVFELGFALSAWTLGDAALKRLGIDPAKAKADAKFNLLRTLGLSAKQVDALNERICGTQTIEGAPHVQAEHLPVFDCANTCGRKGTRSIAVEGHIRMMAAAQPFISGAISKTINLPHEAEVEDIAAAYRLSWELGLKANALYRDGCKLSQPLSSKSRREDDEDAAPAEPADIADGADDASQRADTASGRLAQTGVRVLEGAMANGSESQREGAKASSSAQVAVEPRVKVVERPLRRRLPDTRRSLTHKFNIAGHEGYLTVGLYADGSPGELFITMAKEGSTIGGLMDSLGTAVSVALQYGVPVESLVNKFAHQRFEPAGMTTNSDIPFAKSLVDYIFRWLGMQFVAGYQEANAPQRVGEGEGEGEAIAARELPRSAEARDDAEQALEGASSMRDANGSHGPSGAGAARVSARRSRVETTTEVSLESDAAAAVDTLSQAMRDCQGDAPACEVCGTITVRNGSCYKCLNCGHSMGCS